MLCSFALAQLQKRGGGNTVTAGDNTVMTGDSSVMAGDNTVMARDNTVTAGDNTVTAGDNTATAGAPWLQHYSSCWPCCYLLCPQAAWKCLQPMACSCHNGQCVSCTCGTGIDEQRVCVCALPALHAESTGDACVCVQPQGAVELAEGLVNNVSLHILNMAWNGLENIGCTAIAQALHKNMGLQAGQTSVCIDNLSLCFFCCSFSALL